MNQSEFLVNQVKISKDIALRTDASTNTGRVQLLNLTLSLVVLPYEQMRAKGNRSFSKSLSELQKEIGFSTVLFAPIKNCDKDGIRTSKREIYQFVRKFRNAIAHQHVVFSSNSGEPILEFTNYYHINYCSNCDKRYCEKNGLEYSKDGICDFRVCFTYEQLKSFAIWIAASYLESSFTGSEKRDEQ